MKKLLLVLGMVACLFGLTACGKNSEDTGNSEEIIKSLETNLGSLPQFFDNITEVEQKDQFEDYGNLYKGIESWEAAAADMGNYMETKGVTATLSKKEATVLIDVTGSERDAQVEIVVDLENYEKCLKYTEMMAFDKAQEAYIQSIKSVTTNVTYSFGELMAKAGLNTLLGMGTVFAVLILISIIIYGFKFIPAIEEAFKKKPQQTKEPAVTSVAQEEVVEELTDDYELVAVIAAAIAAAEGTSTDGFVVRSIRRIENSRRL